MKRLSLLLGLLGLVLVWGSTPSTVRARTLPDDVVVDGQTYVLPPGQIQDGDLVVVRGRAEIKPGARVQGDVIVFGGSVVSEGVIDGDVAISGGDVVLRGVVEGDVILVGGVLRLEDGARVEGDIARLGGQLMQGPGVHLETPPPFGLHPPFPWRLPWLPWHLLPSPKGTPTLATLLLRTILVGLRALVIALLAALVVALFPTTAAQTRESIHQAPLLLSAVGLLTLAALPVVLVVLALTVLLLPLAVAVLAVVLLLALYGWIVVGYDVGRWLFDALHTQAHPAAVAAVGAFLLTLVADGLRLIPCIGWVPGLLVLALGLGGALKQLWAAWEKEQARLKRPAPADTEATSTSEAEE